MSKKEDISKLLSYYSSNSLEIDSQKNDDNISIKERKMNESKIMIKKKYPIQIQIIILMKHK